MPSTKVIHHTTLTDRMYSDIIEKWNKLKKEARDARVDECRRLGHMYSYLPWTKQTLVCRRCIKYVPVD